MMANRPTQNAWALKHYIDQGWEADVVERVIRLGPTAVKHDLFGFGDLFAFRGRRNLIVQVTTYKNHSTRKKKILSVEKARKWLNASPYNEIEVISIDHAGDSGQKGRIRIEAVALGDFV